MALTKMLWSSGLALAWTSVRMCTYFFPGAGLMAISSRETIFYLRLFRWPSSFLRTVLDFVGAEFSLEPLVGLGVGSLPKPSSHCFSKRLSYFTFRLCVWRRRLAFSMRISFIIAFSDLSPIFFSQFLKSSKSISSTSYARWMLILQMMEIEILTDWYFIRPGLYLKDSTIKHTYVHTQNSILHPAIHNFRNLLALAIKIFTEIYNILIRYLIYL